MSDSLTVSQLCERLFDLFPLADAESWDHVGLSVGDPTAPVSGVACALDVTPYSIRQAAQLGFNVLLTHHPVCLDMPRVISPERSGAATPGSSIWQAIESDVSLIAMHTNLDRSPRAALRMPLMLGLDDAQPNIERARAHTVTGLGAFAHAGSLDTIGKLVNACHQHFGRVAQVYSYGTSDDAVHSIAFYSGSMGSDGCADVKATGADAVVCGECGYHRALDLLSTGIRVIVLGHDASELPHVACLYDAALECGIDEKNVRVLDERRTWHEVTDF